jgi:hypothetical protein
VLGERDGGRPRLRGQFETRQQRDQGAFGPNGGAVRTVNTFGSPLAGILGGAVPATLVSIFGVPPTFDPTVDAAGNLPGPGAATVPGIGELCETVNPCVPPVTPTTTTLPGATTTTSTLITTTSSIALTTTSTSTSTTSTLFPGCPPPANPLGAVTFVTELGTTDCGGPGLTPPAAAPFSGSVTDGNGMLIRNLGAGCLNVGGACQRDSAGPRAGRSRGAHERLEHQRHHAHARVEQRDRRHQLARAARVRSSTASTAIPAPTAWASHL